MMSSAPAGSWPSPAATMPLQKIETIDEPRSRAEEQGSLFDAADLEAWLSGTAGPELLRPGAENRLRMRPVSRQVNRTGGGADGKGHDLLPSASPTPGCRFRDCRGLFRSAPIAC
jgi:hypothetical protein